MKNVIKENNKKDNNIKERTNILKMIDPYSKGVIEYTFEANPESLSETKIKMLSQYGVNRVSIGVQSTDDEILKYVNRGHTFKEVVAAIDLLHKHGIHNINVDLILGLPHTSKKSCLDLLKLLKKKTERIDHVCGRLIEEMGKEKHE